MIVQPAPLTIYLAGPISGLSYEAVVDRYKTYVPALRDIGFNVIFPMTAKGYLRNEIKFKAHGDANPVSTNGAIVGRDEWMVHQCDILVADLAAATERVSIGTVCEISWAHLLHKHILVTMTEENFHHHAFILEQAHIILPSMSEILEYLTEVQLAEHAL